MFGKFSQTFANSLQRRKTDEGSYVDPSESGSGRKWTVSVAIPSSILSEYDRKSYNAFVIEIDLFSVLSQLSAAIP